MKQNKQNMSLSRIGIRIALLVGCSLFLTSCGTVGSILNYLISLPLNILKAVCP